MKHLLNNLSKEEKNNIRNQHKGGLKVVTENFKKLVNNKLGTVGLIINEQGLKETVTNNVATEGIKNVSDQMVQSPPFNGYYSGYVIQGEFNNVNYQWNLLNVEGMSGIRGMSEGVITSEKNSGLQETGSKVGVDFPEPLENGVWVGFSSNNGDLNFICYMTKSNRPKVVYFKMG